MEKYRQIYNDILERLRNGEFDHDNKLLPSDQQLVMKYKTSRETVRKAMKLLADEGYVQRLRGKGTIAIERRQFLFPVAEIKSYQELVDEAHLKSKTTVLSISQSAVPEWLGPVNDTLTWRVVRLREVENEPDVIDYDYILCDVVDEIPIYVAQNSLFAYFEQELGLTIDYAIKKVTVEQATIDDQRHLKISAHTPIVVVRSRTYLADSRILSYTESRHRADRFSSVEFARRVH